MQRARSAPAPLTSSRKDLLQGAEEEATATGREYPTRRESHAGDEDDDDEDEEEDLEHVEEVRDCLLRWAASLATSLT